jgi:phosphoglycolate phosphatase-like HAD superfamily hydrolase
VAAITTSFPRERLLEVEADYVVDSYAELNSLLGL